MGRRILRQVYIQKVKHKLRGFVHSYIYCPFDSVVRLSCIVTVQDVNFLHAAGDHTLSKGSIRQKQVLPQDELNFGPQHYNNVPATEAKKADIY